MIPFACHRWELEHLALDLRGVIRPVLLAISARSSQARGQDRLPVVFVFMTPYPSPL